MFAQRAERASRVERVSRVGVNVVEQDGIMVDVRRTDDIDGDSNVYCRVNGDAYATIQGNLSSFLSDNDAYYYDGSDTNYIKLPNDFMDSYSAYTLEFYCKPTAVNSTLLNPSKETTQYISVYVFTDSTVSMDYRNSVYKYRTFTSTKLDFTSIYHITIVHDGYAPALYINGVEEFHTSPSYAVYPYIDGTRTTQNLATNDYKNLGTFWRPGDSKRNGLHGNLYEFRLYNRALTKAEVVNNYNATTNNNISAPSWSNTLTTASTGELKQFPGGDKKYIWYSLYNGYTGAIYDTTTENIYFNYQSVDSGSTTLRYYDLDQNKFSSERQLYRNEVDVLYNPPYDYSHSVPSMLIFNGGLHSFWSAHDDELFITGGNTTLSTVYNRAVLSSGYTYPTSSYLLNQDTAYVLVRGNADKGKHSIYMTTNGSTLTLLKVLVDFETAGLGNGWAYAFPTTFEDYNNTTRIRAVIQRRDRTFGGHGMNDLYFMESLDGGVTWLGKDGTDITAKMPMDIDTTTTYSLISDAGPEARERAWHVSTVSSGDSILAFYGVVDTTRETTTGLSDSTLLRITARIGSKSTAWVDSSLGLWFHHVYIQGDAQMVGSDCYLALATGGNEDSLNTSGSDGGLQIEIFRNQNIWGNPIGFVPIDTVYYRSDEDARVGHIQFIENYTENNVNKIAFVFIEDFIPGQDNENSTIPDSDIYLWIKDVTEY